MGQGAESCGGYDVDHRLEYSLSLKNGCINSRAKPEDVESLI